MATVSNGTMLWLFCKNLVERKAGYVWGARGNIYNESERDYLYKNYSTAKYDKTYYYTTQWARWRGKIVVDCSGMIQAFRATLDKVDLSAQGLYKECTKKATIKSLPKNTRGLLLFIYDKNLRKMTHVGVYGGNGEVIEAMGSSYGVVKTSIDISTASGITSSRWTHWGIAPWCIPVDIVVDNEIIGGGIVNTAALNVRKGPSSAKYASVRVITKGTKVPIYETNNGWGKISDTAEEWVSIKYLDELPKRVVSAGTLTVRTGPKATYKAAGYIHKGDHVWVFNKSSNGVWVNIDPVKDYWVSATFTKEVKES